MTAPAPLDPTPRRQPPRHAARPTALRATRRTFLWVAGAAAAGGCLVQASSAHAATTVTLWRLDADWGVPVGPKQVTACRCTACHRHAANKIYFAEQAAIDGRIHPCCVCQPVPFTVPATTGDELLALSADGTSVDRRHDGISDVLAAGGVPAPSGGPTTPTTPGSTGVPAVAEPGSTDEGSSASPSDASTGAVGGGTVGTDRVVAAGDVGATRAARPRSLALTGTDTAAPLGVLALGAGAVMWQLGRRGRVADDAPVDD